VVSRVVRLLDAFAPGDTALGVSEIARRSGLHVATASRLVAELVQQGLLVRLDDRRVRPGVRLWELASRASPTLGLREAAMPSLQDLHGVVGHHVQLAVLDGHEVLHLERLSAAGAVVNLSRIAGRLPLHLSSSGLVLLAAAPEEVRAHVQAAELPGLTPASITTAARLRAEVARVRAQGYALCVGHVHPEATGIAVPVRDGRGDVVAALSAIVPATSAARRLVPALQAAARGTTRRLSAGVPGDGPGRAGLSLGENPLAPDPALPAR